LGHGAATLLLAQGVAARVVMDVLGHSQISTTQNVYQHVMPSLVDEAAAGIDRALGDTA
jgi:site-specific recombinase XerD